MNEGCVQYAPSITLNAVAFRQDFQAELVVDGDPPIGQERIRVCHADGRVQELYLHDYEQLYALPGVYEQIVQERLGSAGPRQSHGRPRSV